MENIIKTILNSLNDLLAEGIKAVPNLFAALVVLFLARFAVKLAANLADETGKRILNSHSLRMLLDKTIRVGVWTIGILIACVLAFPGLTLGQIISTLGIGSVAISFAFQDIFKNFMAGIILLIEEPFRIGDEVVVGEYQGTIKHISIRTTRILTYQGERVLLPNSTLFTDAVKVFTAHAHRRTDLGLGVDYNTDLIKASQILDSIVRNVTGVLDQPAPEVDIVTFGDSSIDLVIRYWTEPQQKQVRQVQTKVMVAIKKAFDAANINIPYPIRTLYYYNQEKYQDYFSRQPNDRQDEQN